MPGSFLRMIRKIRRRKKDPTVSVILPTLNRADRVILAVDSVLSQTFGDWELLIVDNRSSDGTADRLRPYARRDDRISLLREDERGVARARNAGLRAARGSIITYLDSDNTWRESYLEKTVEALRGKSRACSYAAMMIHGHDGRWNANGGSLLDRDFDRQEMLQANQIDLNTFAHTKDLYEALGGFDPELTRLVDWDLILRYTRDNDPIKITMVGADYYHHSRVDRVGINEPYAISRLLISLRHSLADGCRAILVKDDATIEDAEDFSACGLPFEIMSKEKALNAWEPLGDEVVIWHGGEWDSQPGLLTAFSGKIASGGSPSFYLIPDDRIPAGALGEAVYVNFRYYVTRGQSQKKAFLKKLDERGIDSGSPFIDRVLLRDGGPDHLNYRNFLRLLENYHYPRARELKIALGIQPLTTENPLEWGDYQFAGGLAGAFEKKGFPCEILCRDRWSEAVNYPVYIHLYGIHQPPPRPERSQVRLLWIISHLDRLDMDGLPAFDRIFTASAGFADHARESYPDLPVSFLPQATDPEIFRPMDLPRRWDYVFVGNSRKVDRPVVRYAAESGRSFALWGNHWLGTAAEGSLQEGFLTSPEVAAVYNRAGIVLNDHWADQKEWGIVNNRIFDVLACCKFPLTDDNPGIDRLFPDLAQYRTREEFTELSEKLFSGYDKAAFDTLEDDPRYWVLKKHTFDHRAHTFLTAIGREKNNASD